MTMSLNMTFFFIEGVPKEKCKKPKEVHKQNSLLSFVKVENISKLLQSG